MTYEGINQMDQAAHDEVIVEQKYNAMLLAPEGLGFGSGSIGVEVRLADEADGLNEAVLTKVDEAITSDNILVDVDHGKDGNLLYDDGCGDGREVARVFRGVVLKTKSLVRSKVFGGAAVMATAAAIGTGEASGKKLNPLFSWAVQKLESKGIGIGGHSDTHAHGQNCGCGAIDKAPLIVSKVTDYNDEIRSVVGLLGLDVTTLDGDDGIFANYDNYLENEVSGFENEYSGRKALDELLDIGKVVKELDGTHNEVRIVLNTVEGKTVNQELIRGVSDGLAQVFAVDVWRLKQIAEGMYDDPVAQNKALVSMVVHTLGVAATLTKGDLPVYVVSEANASAPTEDPSLVAA